MSNDSSGKISVLTSPEYRFVGKRAHRSFRAYENQNRIHNGVIAGL